MTTYELKCFENAIRRHGGSHPWRVRELVRCIPALPEGHPCAVPLTVALNNLAFAAQLRFEALTASDFALRGASAESYDKAVERLHETLEDIVVHYREALRPQYGAIRELEKLVKLKKKTPPNKQ